MSNTTDSTTDLTTLDITQEDVTSAVNNNWEEIAPQLDLDPGDEPDWIEHIGLTSDVTEQGRFYCAGQEWMVLYDDQANELACQLILDSLWAFNPSFLAGATGIDEVVLQDLIDNGRCEDNNAAVTALIKGTCGLDTFVDKALSADGRGHFISGYDSEEHEIVVYGMNLYFYRLN